MEKATKTTSKKASSKKAKAPEKKAKAPEKKAFQNKGKTELVLKMVTAKKTRKEILDKLVTMDSSISRKSNAGLVSHIFKANDLLGKVESGSERGAPKKKVVVKAKKTTKAKA